MSSLNEIQRYIVICLKVLVQAFYIGTIIGTYGLKQKQNKTASHYTSENSHIAYTEETRLRFTDFPIFYFIKE